MPLTPFHLGPAFFLGELFEKRVNLIPLLLGSIIIDVRAAYCLFSGCRPLHGPLHTFFSATLIACMLAWLVFSQRQWLQKVTERFRIIQTYSFTSILMGALIGTWSHVLLDSFLYTDIIPFWPLRANPLLGMAGPGVIYLICLLTFLPATGMYFYRYSKRS
jgi:membrane-bound metal-dependent hydrolase YbcI (DUF457 family)